MARIRVDELLVARGLAGDRAEAARLILGGAVRAESGIPLKPGLRVADDIRLVVAARPRYVSRAGEKLESALRHFGLVVEGKVCADLGASTGGFTDCLLQHGARKVYAFDVGKGILDWKLRQDPRVVVSEGVNVRYLDPRALPERVELVTADLSFISLRRILPVIAAFEPADALVLVKPQFEARREEVPAGGVVRDEEIRQRVLDEVSEAAAACGLAERGRYCSPLPGARGNREFFLWLQLTHPSQGERTSLNP
ncbi:MAG: TlyA family rRNA (cytidine-2'-O)-methyltransferase [Acidobacteriota bacterium]